MIKFDDETKKSKSAVYCGVPGCNVKSISHPSVSFHHFPKPNNTSVFITNYFGKKEKIDKFEAWKRSLKLQTVISSSTRVCSLHFQKNDYILPDVPALRRRLKFTAIPNINLPKDATKSRKQKLSQARRARRLKRQVQKAIVDVGMSHEVMNDNSMATGEPNTMEIQSHFVDVPSLKMELEEEEEEKARDEVERNSIGVQANIEPIRYLSIIRNQKQLRILTGIPSFSVLTSISEIVRLVKIEHADDQTNLSAEDKVLLTYGKLKEDLPFELSAFFCKNSIEACEHIFINTVPLLSTCLKSRIAWPIKEENEMTESIQFKGLDNVKVFLHCTTITSEIPDNRDRYEDFDSDSDSDLDSDFDSDGDEDRKEKSSKIGKRPLTYKLIIGVSLDGSISFISKVSDGSKSDTAVFEESGIISLLQPGDAVMADQSFQIDDFCKKYSVQCIRPPLLTVNKSESPLEKTIVEAIKLVEKSIKKLESFEIFIKSFPAKYNSLLYDIFVLVSVIVNMSLPITEENDAEDNYDEQDL